MPETKVRQQLALISLEHETRYSAKPVLGEGGFVFVFFGIPHRTQSRKASVALHNDEGALAFIMFHNDRLVRDVPILNERRNKFPCLHLTAQQEFLDLGL